MSEHEGRRRVVITGVGAVTPCGLDVDESWRNIREGRSGVSIVEGFEGHVKIAAQVSGRQILQLLGQSWRRWCVVLSWHRDRR